MFRSDYLKECVEKSGLDIDDISLRTDLPTDLIYSIKYGYIDNPNTTVLIKIARVLGNDLGDFYDDRPDNSHRASSPRLAPKLSTIEERVDDGGTYVFNRKNFDLTIEDSQVNIGYICDKLDLFSFQLEDYLDEDIQYTDAMIIDIAHVTGVSMYDFFDIVQPCISDKNIHEVIECIDTRIKEINRRKFLVLHNAEVDKGVFDGQLQALQYIKDFIVNPKEEVNKEMKLF